MHLTNSGESSVYRWQSISRSNHTSHSHIQDVGTISGKGFLAKGSSNDSVFNVNGNTYHYTAIANKASSTKGGLGSQTGIQAMSNFYTNLPDYIQYVRDDGITGIGNLYLFDGPSNRIQYASHTATVSYYIDFNNDAEGSYQKDGFINEDAFGANLSLSGYIAKGKAYYVGGGGATTAAGGGSSTFLDLTDTPSDFNAGKYLKVSNDGTKLEYKNITINDTNDFGDGGIGSHTGVQAESKFYRNLPDQILLEENDGAGSSWTGVASLKWYHGDRFNYDVNGTYWIEFSNNAEGTYADDGNINENAYGNNLSLSGYIAKGRAVFLGETKKGFGQYSGIDKGDFEHRIPEYIYPHDVNGKVTTIMHFYHATDPGGFCYTARSNHE